MKKYLFLILVLTYSIFAQDKEPGQHKFNFLGIEQYLSADSSYFKQDKFILGYQWGCSKKITQATFCNQTDITHKFIYPDYFNNNTYVILKPSEYSHAVGGEDLNARGIEYSPVTKIATNVPGKLVKRAGDTTRRCFGYKYIRGKISNNPTDSFYNSLVVGGDSLNNQVVLAEPWPCNQLSQFGSKYQTDSLGQIIMNSHLCQTLIFNINLRRLDNDDMTNDTILKIELPYVRKDSSSNNIQFSTIPINTQYPLNIDIYLDTIRGFFKDTVGVPRGKRDFFITKQMLPPSSCNSSITLSAFFRCNDDYRDNPKLKTSIDPQTGTIDSIKIKITYLGGCDIVINNTSLTTPHAQYYFLGGYDSVLVDSVKGDLSKFEALNNNNIKLFRYVTIVEGSLQHWWAEKYFNKLIGNLSCSEAGVCYPKHFEYYVNPPSRWFGVLLPLIKYL